MRVLKCHYKKILQNYPHENIRAFWFDVRGNILHRSESQSSKGVAVLVVPSKDDDSLYGCVIETYSVRLLPLVVVVYHTTMVKALQYQSIAHKVTDVSVSPCSSLCQAELDLEDHPLLGFSENQTALEISLGLLLMVVFIIAVCTLVFACLLSNRVTKTFFFGST